MSSKNSALAHIARPYATALFDLANESGSLDAVEGDLVALTDLINESDDFNRFLRSPVIDGGDKSAVIDQLINKGNIGGVTANFLKLVARNRRLFALGAIISEFREMAADARGELTASVTSASPLTDEQEKALAEALKAKLGKTVSLDKQVDASLIGGLIVQVGSQMIDSSIRTKLSAMKIAMKEVG